MQLGIGCCVETGIRSKGMVDHLGVGKVIHYPAGRADHDMHPFPELDCLCHHVDTPHQGCTAHVDARPQSLELLRYLCGKQSPASPMWKAAPRRPHSYLKNAETTAQEKAASSQAAPPIGIWAQARSMRAPNTLPESGCGTCGTPESQARAWATARARSSWSASAAGPAEWAAQRRRSYRSQSAPIR